MHIPPTAVPTSTTGSVFAAQRLPKNAQPGKVEINRSIYKKTRGTDGKTYGRTEIQRLLRVESGTEQLSAREEAFLRAHDVCDGELADINRRLSELAGPARAHAVAADMHAADVHIQAAVAIGANTRGALRFVLDRLADAQLVLDDGGASRRRHTERAVAVTAPAERLLRALHAVNAACAEAQEVYPHLPTGSDASDELVLEFQKTWFSHQAMVNMLRQRECFYRPGGWSNLRDQVLGGRVYRKGRIKVKRARTDNKAGEPGA